MAEPKNESLHLLLSLSPPSPISVPLAASSSLFDYTLPTVPLCSSLFLFPVYHPRFLPLSVTRVLVPRSFNFGITWRTCMHACMHFEAEDGSTRFRPGSRLSFSSRRREPQLVKKLPDRLGARRADSAVVYDPTPNTLSAGSALCVRLLHWAHPCDVCTPVYSTANEYAATTDARTPDTGVFSAAASLCARGTTGE